LLLTPQEDETKLAAECALVGGLLGCGDGARQVGGKPTLAKIMRGLAAGAVRARCELRERRIQVSSRSIRTQPRARTTTTAAQAYEACYCSGKPMLQILVRCCCRRHSQLAGSAGWQ
jgi:hypothetical protein